ncbi:MAG: DUF2845 domain-containing protein [Pseudomonadota bacterium]
MTKRVVVLGALLSIIAAVGVAGAATILRCNNQLVQVGAEKFEVSQKCGEPLSKEVVGEISVKSANGKEKSTVSVEKWVYDLQPSFYDVLTFQGGRLKAMEWLRK